MTADLQEQGYVNATVLYMALELSNTKWRLWRSVTARTATAKW